MIVNKMSKINYTIIILEYHVFPLYSKTVIVPILTKPMVIRDQTFI